MSSREYSVVFDNFTVPATNALDFFQFNVLADKPMEMVGLILGQSSEVTTNVAEDEFLRYQIARGYTTTGSGGTTPTANPMDPANPAAGTVTMVNNTTVASGGTAVILHNDTFNIRQGLQLWWPLDFGPAATNASGQDFLVVRLLVGPADTIQFSGTAYFREV